MPANATIIRGEQILTISTLLLEGWMCRYEDLTKGKRQITELHIAADSVDRLGSCVCMPTLSLGRELRSN